MVGLQGHPSVSSVGRTKLLGRVQIIRVHGSQSAGEGRPNTLNTPTSTIGYRGTPTNVVVEHFSCITTCRAHLLPSRPSRRRGLCGGSIGEPSRSQEMFLPRSRHSDHEPTLVAPVSDTTLIAATVMTVAKGAIVLAEGTDVDFPTPPVNSSDLFE